MSRFAEIFRDVLPFRLPPIAIMQNLPTLAKTSTGYIAHGL